jgi:hypothetical protein
MKVEILLRTHLLFNANAQQEHYNQKDKNNVLHFFVIDQQQQ